MASERGRQAAWTLIGLSAGVATGVWLWRRNAPDRVRGPELRGWEQPRGSAQDVTEALSRDTRLRGRDIRVDALAEGVVELTGHVADRRESERAVELAQGTTGVYTVVNRLTVDAEEARREQTRRRWNEGAPELRERHHYGMGVGMGTRRQSPATDPDRPSEKQRMLERELDVEKVNDEPNPPTPDVTGESRVSSSDMKPRDERAIEEAGLAGSHDVGTEETSGGPGPREEPEEAEPVERAEEQRG